MRRRQRRSASSYIHCTVGAGLPTHVVQGRSYAGRRPSKVRNTRNFPFIRRSAADVSQLNLPHYPNNSTNSKSMAIWSVAASARARIYTRTDGRTARKNTASGPIGRIFGGIKRRRICSKETVMVWVCGPNACSQLLCPNPRGHFGIARSVRLSVP